MGSKWWILVLVFCGWFVQVKAQSIKADIVLPRLVIDNCYFKETDNNYLVLSIYIVNNSNNTLKYWDPSVQLNEFFTVQNKEGLQLVSENVDSYKRILLAPHCSQHIELKFVENPYREGVSEFKVAMKFYPWFEGSHFTPEVKDRPVKVLADSINITRDGMYGICLPQSVLLTKRNLIIPSINLEANAPDKKMDTITVDEKAITKIPVYSYPWHSLKIRTWSQTANSKSEPGFLIPVTIHNYGEKTLFYDSMSCTWEDDYSVNNQKFAILLRYCKRTYRNL